MGYFTWKDCQNRRKSIGYSKAVVICPDNSMILEDAYGGFGIFGGKDIYELVVDWNRPYLKEIFDRKKTEGKDIRSEVWYEIAVAAMKSDQDAREIVLAYRDRLPEYISQSEKEWKRELGILIGCEDEDNEALPFPIKISATVPRKPYDQLQASWSCQ